MNELKHYIRPTFKITLVDGQDILTVSGEIDPWKSPERFESIEDDDF